ncbi:MAG TPA: ABC transporter ATP-binding protein [Ilumatobacteraceae bacterium]|nr:ABC transporter ATP-binding protein [Ilumatobacteraceae bacterium]
MSELEVRDIRVAFESSVVLDGVSLHVASGESVALLGPSGSGKSTLLRVIAGMIAPDAGIVMVDGIDVTHLATHRRGVGMVFQDNQLFPHLSTLDNVTFGPKLAGASKDDRNELGRMWLDRVGLAGFDNRSVTELSGGEAKRVALARTLAAQPSVVLLDEPLTGLDRELHDRLAVDLAELLQPITTLLVTHDAEEAAVVADRIVALADL